MKRPERKWLFMPFRGWLWSIKPEYFYNPNTRGGRVDKYPFKQVKDRNRGYDGCRDLRDQPRKYMELSVVRINMCQRGRDIMTFDPACRAAHN